MGSGTASTIRSSRLGRFFSFPHAGSRFAALEAYRAIAAMMVVVYHIAGTRAYTYSEYLSGRLLNALGNFGVCIFLLLSGFLLFHPFVRAHLRDTPMRDLKVYFRHRFLRILPAYWIALTVSLMLIPVGIKGSPTPEWDPATYFKLYFLIGNFTRGLSYSGLAVAWTLHLEVVFYLCLPLFAWITRRVFGRKARSLGSKVRANLVLLAIMVVVAQLYRYGIRADKIEYRSIWFPNYLDWFAAGMLLAVISNWLDMGGTLPRWARLFADDTLRCWLLGASLFVVIAATMSPGIPAKETTVELLVRFTLAMFTAFLLLVPATLGQRRDDPLKRVFATAPFAFLGMISYGLYLWHAPMLFKLIHTDWWLNLKLKPYNGFWLEFAVIVPPAILVAAASYYLIEKPMMRFKNPREAQAYTVVSSGRPTIDDIDFVPPAEQGLVPATVAAPPGDDDVPAMDDDDDRDALTARSA